MHRSFCLFAFTALSLPIIALANNTKGDEAHPTTTFSIFPPGRPTPVPDSTKHLEPGQRFADPKTNPFTGALSYSPPRLVTHILHNSTKLPEQGGDDQCLPLISGFTQTFAANHHTVFHLANRTVQTVGFALEVFKQAVANSNDHESVVGEVSRGQEIKYVMHTEEDEKEDDSPVKRKILGPDTRTEDFDTWIFPWSVVGEVGGGRCTGKSVLA